METTVGAINSGSRKKPRRPREGILAEKRKTKSVRVVYFLEDLKRIFIRKVSSSKGCIIKYRGCSFFRFENVTQQKYLPFLKRGRKEGQLEELLIGKPIPLEKKKNVKALLEKQFNNADMQWQNLPSLEFFKPILDEGSKEAEQEYVEENEPIDDEACDCLGVASLIYMLSYHTLRYIAQELALNWLIITDFKLSACCQETVLQEPPKIVQSREENGISPNLPIKRWYNYNWSSQNFLILNECSVPCQIILNLQEKMTGSNLEDIFEGECGRSLEPKGNVFSTSEDTMTLRFLNMRHCLDGLYIFYSYANPTSTMDLCKCLEI
nr:unnamed protein product [Callosobruchus chinensis]